MRHHLTLLARFFFFFFFLFFIQIADTTRTVGLVISIVLNPLVV